MMNKRLSEIKLQSYEVDPKYPPPALVMKFNEEKFAELILREAFTIIEESMVGDDNVSNIDEIIADRLDEAAYDVCDKLGLLGPIYGVE